MFPQSKPATAYKCVPIACVMNDVVCSWIQWQRMLVFSVGETKRRRLQEWVNKPNKLIQSLNACISYGNVCVLLYFLLNWQLQRRLECSYLDWLVSRPLKSRVYACTKRVSVDIQTCWFNSWQQHLLKRVALKHWIESPDSMAGDAQLNSWLYQKQVSVCVDKLEYKVLDWQVE